ncbi:MAG: CAP domain-containing protein [Gammaproteobacteria bacterium]
MTARRNAAAALAAVLVGAAMLAAPSARADTLSLVNALRKQGCGRIPSAPALKANQTLNTAARELARSGKLRESVEDSGYSAARSASLHIKGPTSDADIRRELSARSCASLIDPEVTELGAYRRADETWIVLAKPLPKPPVLVPAAQAARVLVLVNAARAQERKCGRQRFAATSALKPSAILAGAAAEHARDMAEHAKLTHTGSDGSRPPDRITRAGYNWRATGENVASGQRDADAVVVAWLESPGHCANIMEPSFTEMGVAFVQVPGANPNIYWAQSFATPR